MKRILLATVAVGTMAFPAMAMDNQGKSAASDHPSQAIQQGGSTQDSGRSQDRMSSQQRSDTQVMSKSGSRMHADAGQNQAVQPSSLSSREIRLIQMNLNKAGFSAKSVDGVWGEETQAALRNFQEMKNLAGDGKLNQQTLAALGVTLEDQSSTTVEKSRSELDEHRTTGAAMNKNAAPQTERK